MAGARYFDWLTEDGLSQLEGWARDGLSNDQIAKNIGCARSTFQAWMKKYPEMRDAIKRGKAPVDFEVENALLKRALGYTYEETRRYATVDEHGRKQQVVETKTCEVPPDTGAAIFWLKNRRPDVWREERREGIAKTKAETEKVKAETEVIKTADPVQQVAIIFGGEDEI